MHGIPPRPLALAVFFAIAELYAPLALAEIAAASPEARPATLTDTSPANPATAAPAAQPRKKRAHKPRATIDPPAQLPPGNGGSVVSTLFTDPFRLRLQSRMLPLANTSSDDPRPTFLIANELTGRQEDRTDAKGNVELRKLGTRLFADELTYWPQGDEVEARGNVRLEQGKDVIRGPLMRQKLSEQTGYFERPSYYFQREVVTDLSQQNNGNNVTSVLAFREEPLISRRTSEAFGSAERADLQGKNQRYLTWGTYSSCSPSQPDWFTKAEKLHLDYDRNEGTGNNATVYFKDTPIFYTPYMEFALNGQRKSGLLAPTWASSTRNGFDFVLPYYVNLSPNYDMTLYPRHMGTRGLQLGSEVRYLGYNYNGEARFEYLPTDQQTGKSRHAYSIRHNQTNLGRGFSGSLNLNGVSDNQYWSDLTSALVQTSQTQLVRQGLLNYASGSWWNANAQILQYQTLQPASSVVIARPYFMEPQFNFNGRLPDLYRTDLTLMGQFTRFTHPTQVQGNRVVAYPQLALPLVRPGYYVIPKLGYHVTQYQLSQQTAGEPTQFTRNLPVASLDAGLVFERDANLFGKALQQTLEPRLFYVNIPYQDQSRMPVFDSGLADFNFAQIFSENRYVGQDRIGDANQLTAALTTRFIDPKTGAERLKAMIGQRYYFRDQRVTISGEASQQQGNSSNYLAALNTTLLPKVYADLAMEYDPKAQHIRRMAIGAKYQPSYARVLSATYRVNRDAANVIQTDQIDLATQWPIRGKWFGVARYNYDIKAKKTIESLAGLEYNAGCWVGRFILQQTTTVGGIQNTTYAFQLELNDFAQIGSNPLQLLRRSVPGYSKVNEASSDLINQ